MLRVLKLNKSLSMEPQSTQDATRRVAQILDAKDKKADLQSIVKENCKHLSADQQQQNCSFSGNMSCFLTAF